MFKLNTRKYPQYFSFPTHTVVGEKFFISLEQLKKTEGILPPDYRIPRGTPILDNKKVILLDYGLGKKASWSLVKVIDLAENNIGYVPTNSLIPNDDSIKPLIAFNQDSQYSPNWMAEEIEWFRQTPYVVYEDLKNGCYCVNWEFPDVVDFTPESDSDIINGKMQEAFEKGVELILKDKGYDTSKKEIINNFINNYYSFCRAEEWQVDIRPCSSLKVLVAIPKRFIHTPAFEENKIKFSPANIAEILSKIDNKSDVTKKSNLLNQTDNKQKTFNKVFKNYNDFNSFFEVLISTLDIYNFPLISREWIFQPAININFFNEVRDLRTLKDKINRLIIDNASNTVNNKFIYFSAIPSPEEKYDRFESWNGELIISIDTEERKITNIAYFFNDKQILLTENYFSFLNDPIVINKTFVNYLINFDPDKDRFDYVSSLLQSVSGTVTTAATDINAIISSVNPIFFDSLQSGQAFSETPSVLEGSLEEETVDEPVTNELSAAAIAALEFISNLLAGAAAAFGGIIDDNVINFLKNEHYPSIEASALPLDIEECVSTTYNQIQQLSRNNLPDAIALFKEAQKKREIEQPKKESDEFLKAGFDFKNIIDPNLRIVFGIDPIPGKDNQEKFLAYTTSLNAFDWGRFLAFASQCISKAIDPQVLLKLLETYKNARKFIEAILLNTLCNPFLTSFLKKLNSISIPQIDTNNSLGALGDAITQAFMKMLMDLIATVLKKILNEAMKACMNDPNANFGGANGSPPPFGSMPEDDPDIDNLMKDLFEGYDTDPNIKDEAKKKVNEFFDDITACLSTSEFCKLLSNYSVNDEVYEFILALAKRKYKEPFVNRFNDREYVKSFFSRIGSKINLDVCKDFLNDEQPRSSNFLCDDGKILSLRKQILSDKGLSEEAVNELLNDIKNKEEKLLEDVLKLLNSDQPFDFSQVPDLACQVFANGETIAPPQKSMEKTIDALYDSIYTNFNNEAAEWYLTAISVSSSKPSPLEFNQSTGQIKVKQLPTGSSEFNNQSKNAVNTDPKERSQQPSASVSDIKIPYYLFQKTFNSNENNYSFISEENTLEVNIKGYDQQKLDLNIISDQLRNNVSKAESTLEEALRQLEFFLKAKLFKEAFSFAMDVAADDRDTLQALAAKAFTNNELYRYFKLIDLYINNNLEDIYDVKKMSEEYSKILGFKTSQEASAFYSLNQGMPLYLILAKEFFEENGNIKSQVNQLILFCTSINTVNYYSSTNTEIAVRLTNLFKIAGQEYANVRKYFRVVLNTKTQYPDYKINLQSGLSEYVIPLQQSVNFGTGSDGKSLEVTIGNQNQQEIKINNLFNGDLYDIYNLKVTKNSKKHINITDFVKVNREITEYIFKNILTKTQNNNIEKQEIFFKFIENLQGDRNSNNFGSQKIYHRINEQIYENIKNNILSDKNKFMLLKGFQIPTDGIVNQNILLQRSSSLGQPYVQKLKLIVDPTQQQQLCNIRPHYLDFDSVKNEIKEKQKSNTCARQIINDDVINQRPVDSNSIENLQTTATQKNLLNGVYRLAIRLHVHEIVLRGLSSFGYYDPQSLRNDRLFSNFISDLVEIEMRTIDTVFFNMLTAFYYDEYIIKNPDQVPLYNKTYQKRNLKRILFKQIINDELKNIVLPKLSKRIDIDTNIELKNNSDSTIKLINIYDDIKTFTNIIQIKNKKIFLNTFINSRDNIDDIESIFGEVLIYNDNIYIPIYANNDSDDVWLDFKGSIEFKLLFEYLFPVKQHLSSITISSILCTNARKISLDAFNDTRRDIFKTAKSIQTGGRKVQPDPENPQTMDDENPLLFIAKFILKALIDMPISIFKGFAEGTEPNLAIVTTAFKLGKAFQPELPSIIIPPVSIAGALSGYLPAINPIIYWGYIVGGLWNMDNAKSVGINVEEMFKRLSESTPPDCSDVINQDLYKLSTDDNKPLLNDPINSDFTPYYGVQTATQNLNASSEKLTSAGIAGLTNITNPLSQGNFNIRPSGSNIQ